MNVSELDYRKANNALVGLGAAIITLERLQKEFPQISASKVFDRGLMQSLKKSQADAEAIKDLVLAELKKRDASLGEQTPGSRVARELVLVAKLLSPARQAAELGDPYDSLNDAGEKPRLSGLKPGRTEVWYMKPDFFRDGIMGFKWLQEQGPMPDPKNLKKTHVFLGRIAENDLNEVYDLMQGEKWSPAGEAREFIRRRGLQHTSMSVGDIIVRDGRVAYIVDTSGFKQIPWR